MAEPYVDSNATSYMNAQDQTGDTQGANFNGGVPGVVKGDGGVTTGPPQAGGAGPVQGQISQNVKSAATGEDPLFTAMAGDSKEFVGGIPKEAWDKMSPELQSKLTTAIPVVQKAARAVGGGIGTFAGGAIGTAIGGPWGGLVGGGAGGSLGYDIADDIVKDTTPPSPTTRQHLRDQYEHTKETD